MDVCSQEKADMLERKEQIHRAKKEGKPIPCKNVQCDKLASPGNYVFCAEHR